VRPQSNFVHYFNQIFEQQEETNDALASVVEAIETIGSLIPIPILRDTMDFPQRTTPEDVEIDSSHEN